MRNAVLAPVVLTCVGCLSVPHYQSEGTHGRLPSLEIRRRLPHYGPTDKELVLAVVGLRAQIEATRLEYGESYPVDCTLEGTFVRSCIEFQRRDRICEAGLSLGLTCFYDAHLTIDGGALEHSSGAWATLPLLVHTGAFLRISLSKRVRLTLDTSSLCGISGFDGWSQAAALVELRCGRCAAITAGWRVIEFHAAPPPYDYMDPITVELADTASGPSVGLTLYF